MTAAVPFWDDAFATWDKVRLGDTTLPGVCSVGGAVKRDIEVKKSKGSDGATLKDNGYAPASLSITWRIYTAEQWLAAQAFIPTIHPRTKGGERRPVAIGHPAPNLLGVKTIYVKEIGFPEVTGEKEISIPISAIEWDEEPKKPKPGGYAGSGTGNLDDSVAGEEAALQDAVNEEEARLAWQIEEERRRQEEAWPFSSDGEEVPPFTGDDVTEDFADNAEEGLDPEDEFLETTT
jgi:hypothetical protein